jgi:alkylation response protein AidB-like acyl-CoA dehydrogenase
VDTRYSDEQLALRSATAALLADLGPRTVADLDDTTRQARLAKAADSAGWFDLRGPGEDDGPLATGVEVAIVARELGRAAADTPFLGPVVAADLARQAGADLDARVTSIVLDGALLDVAVRAPSGEMDGVAVDCAGCERGLLVGAAEPGSTASVLDVPLPAPAPATDLTRAVAPLHVDAGARDVRVGPAVAEDMVARTRALALAITVADLVGIMEGTLETTRTYAQEREQYGVAIGSFQAVQHLLAEARVLVEGAVSVAQYAAWAVDALPPDDAWDAGATAKAYCARAARAVCETAIQVHGGIGNTWECFVHVHLRRALLSSALLGDEGHHLRGLARRRLGYDHGL